VRTWRAVAPVAGLVAVTVLLPAGCGYRLAGNSVGRLPGNVRTIAVPAFRNETFAFKMEQSLTAAVVREFLARTTYQIQSREVGSDAVLDGVVTAVYSGPIVFDPGGGRATEVLLTVSMRVSLRDTATGAVLYEANDLVFREPYEISTDPAVYFEENPAAMDRLSRQVAAGIVSAILENF